MNIHTDPLRRPLEAGSKDYIYLRMCLEAAEMSKCPRRGIASLLVNQDGRLKGNGYNGTVSGASNLCGGDYCLRDGKKEEIVHNKACPNIRSSDCGCPWVKVDAIKSGTQLDVGCLHAEMNLISNCQREDLKHGTVYVSAEPCLFCAKMLAQCEIFALFYIRGRYPAGGADFLEKHGVQVAPILMENLT